MNLKNKKIIISSLIVIIGILLIAVMYHYYRIFTAKIIVVIRKDKKVEVYEKVYLSDLIKSINGKIENDFLIDTTRTGKKDIEFSFINDDNIKVNYTFTVNIEDKTPPIIGVPSSYSVLKGYDGDLSKEFFCGDNYDSSPKCIIEGEYDINTPGTYKLTYKATDKDKNEISQKFILNVKEKKQQSTNNNSKVESVDFQDIKNKHKTRKTKIGIDVSKWQGDIDFAKVKEQGVEFAMIRVGSEDANSNFFVDPKFEQNIKGFNEVGIPVGVYYYSYADSVKKARKEAKWVISQIRKYEIDLPVVFDWENWSNYQEYGLSFYGLTEVANEFLNTIKKAGYKGMLYSSKYYLENVWYKTNNKVWLAHYTKETDYQGNYYLWQLCSNGKVKGIDDNLVDINIMYT